jgi:hypothetical protein
MAFVEHSPELWFDDEYKISPGQYKYTPEQIAKAKEFWNSMTPEERRAVEGPERIVYWNDDGE